MKNDYIKCKYHKETKSILNLSTCLYYVIHAAILEQSIQLKNKIFLRISVLERVIHKL